MLISYTVDAYMATGLAAKGLVLSEESKRDAMVEGGRRRRGEVAEADED